MAGKNVEGQLELFSLFDSVEELEQKIKGAGLKEVQGEPVMEQCYRHRDTGETAVAAYLEMDTEFVISSTLKKDNALHGQDKVLAICKELEATEYYNAIGGQQLYSKEDFARQGIQLSFLDTRSIRYAQGSGEFQPNLSILDVLMYNPKEQVQEMLREYDLR